MATFGAGHCAPHQEEAALCIDAHDYQILYGGTHVAVLTRHTLAGKHAARILRLAGGARCVVRARVTVAGATGPEIVTLDHARETLALSGSRYVDLLAGFEHVRAHLATDLKVGQVAF